MTHPKHPDRFCRVFSWTYIPILILSYSLAAFALGYLTDNTSKRTELIAAITLAAAFIAVQIILYTRYFRERFQAERAINAGQLPCPTCGHALPLHPDTTRCTECGRPINPDDLLTYWSKHLLNKERIKKFQTILHANRAQKIADAQSADDPE